MKYRHLSLEERVELYSQLKLKVSLRDIAKSLGRSHSSLVRELKRHTRYGRAYKPVLASKRASRWAAKQRCKAPLKNAATFRYVMDHLELKWTPEDIAGRISLDHPDLSITAESIYRWIYSKNWRKHQLWKYLEQGHIKRRMKYGRRVQSYTQVLDTKRIELRPIEANFRLSLGHKETDLMEGKRSCKKVVSVTSDRLTRVLNLALINNKTGREKLRALLRPAPDKVYWKSITADRGSENKFYLKWETKLNITAYFCNPYSSWEKGTVERSIRYLRRFIPKGSDLNQYSWRDIKKLEMWFNNKPMKCLQYLTPYERMQIELNSLKSGG